MSLNWETVASGGVVMRIVKVAALNICLTLALLEVSLFLAARLGLLTMDLPSFTFANVSPFWTDSNKDFGVWHPVSGQYRHTRSCFDVMYRSNAHGMRDPDRALRSGKPRVVVLGDSFVEGFGVTDGQRLTDVLEARTGIPHLNFGTSGNFGLTQALILYRTLARTFDHTAVILSILPDNDFSDDDWRNADTAYRDRYRPYLVGAYPAYELRYSNPNVLAANMRSYTQTAELFLAEFSHTARAYTYLRGYLKAAAAKDDAGGKAGRGRAQRSRFFEFTPEEFDRTRYVIEQVVALAAPRPVLVMSIPRLGDYTRARQEGRPAPLTQALSRLSAETGFAYIDLLDRAGQQSAFADLFFGCDPHWSPKGHQMAAKELGSWNYYPSSGGPSSGGSGELPVGAIPGPAPAGGN